MRNTAGSYTRTTIFEILDSRGTTDAWLARKAGCSPTYVSKMRSGKRRIPKWFAERAAVAIGLPEEVLFFDLVLPNGSDKRSDEKEPANVG